MEIDKLLFLSVYLTCCKGDLQVSCVWNRSWINIWTTVRRYCGDRICIYSVRRLLSSDFFGNLFRCLTRSWCSVTNALAALKRGQKKLRGISNSLHPPRHLFWIVGNRIITAANRSIAIIKWYLTRLQIPSIRSSNLKAKLAVLICDFNRTR